MGRLEEYFDEVDAARVRRAKELSEIKRIFEKVDNSDIYGVASRAVVVLAYAVWEGFYNECVRAYIKYLADKGGRIRDKDWMLLVSVLDADFDKLRDKNHSFNARREFVENLRTRIECGFESINGKIVEASSNLNFDKIENNYGLLGINVSEMQKHRNKLDKQLVGWRHSVAHGESPNLGAMDIANHIKFTDELLILVADQFQKAALKY